MFEAVHSVWDYYDGPRSGIAAVGGELCHFSCEWDEAADDWAEHFALRRLNAELLILADEREMIWRAWDGAFHRGEVASSTHPGLPGQNARYAALTAKLDDIIASIPCSGMARATFRASPGQPQKPSGMLRDLEVEWLEFKGEHSWTRESGSL